jgi:hypothetical protein
VIESEGYFRVPDTTVQLFVVGQFRAPPGENVCAAWEFVGVFDTEERARAACVGPEYFIGPCQLNQSAPRETQPDWPGAYYPNAAPAAP